MLDARTAAAIGLLYTRICASIHTHSLAFREERAMIYGLCDADGVAWIGCGRRCTVLAMDWPRLHYLAAIEREKSTGAAAASSKSANKGVDFVCPAKEWEELRVRGAGWVDNERLIGLRRGRGGGRREGGREREMGHSLETARRSKGRAMAVGRSVARFASC